MQLKTLTSNSSKFIYIDRLDSIVELASKTKASVFMIEPMNNTLYGSFEEPYSIIHTAIPFNIETKFIFMNTLYNSRLKKDLINNIKSFFFVPEYPMFLFPENRRVDFMNGHMGFCMDTLTFHDTITYTELQDCILAYNPEERFIIDNFLISFNNFCIRYPLLNDPMEFYNMESYEPLLEVMGNKVTDGCKLTSLSVNGKQYSFYLFKSLICQLNKADKMIIQLRTDRVEPNKFMITFIVKKKKAKYDTMPELSNMDIYTNIFVLNLSQ